MFRIAHWLISAVYLLLPLAALVYAIAGARRRQGAAVADALVTMVVGTMLGAGAALLYGLIVGGRPSPGQIFLASYFAIAVLLVLRVIDLITRLVFRRILAKRRLGIVLPALLALCRGLVLIGIGLPYVMSAALTFRPKVLPQGDPQTLLEFPFTTVEFKSTDGVNLSAWWIPATRRPAGRRGGRLPADYGVKTVVLCHGLAANKGTQLSLIRQLVPAGYNALAFDFRAHGQSGGQFTSLGNLERNDVLGAIHWLRQEHPQQAKRIVGIGANMGAAALIAAATDESDDGRSIEAIAAFGVYDDLDVLAHNFSQRALLQPMDQAAASLGLLLASLHAGANLENFSPAKMVPMLWPRPIMVIHATLDRIVPFDQGRDLFDAASFPKRSLWIDDKDQVQVLSDQETTDAVRLFFEAAEPMPAI